MTLQLDQLPRFFSPFSAALPICNLPFSLPCLFLNLSLSSSIFSLFPLSMSYLFAPALTPEKQRTKTPKTCHKRSYIRSLETQHSKQEPFNFNPNFCFLARLLCRLCRAVFCRFVCPIVCRFPSRERRGRKDLQQNVYPSGSKISF